MEGRFPDSGSRCGDAAAKRYDSSWELEYMKRLERDRSVAKWTKNHGITIQYVTEAGNVRGCRPDFLIERLDGSKKLHEIKGGQYLQNPDTLRKHEAARNWCRKVSQEGDEIRYRDQKAVESDTRPRGPTC